MAATDSAEVVSQSTTGNEKLTRFANVLGATFIGMLATALHLWFRAGVGGVGGDGVVYLGTFLVFTALGYIAAKRATQAVPSLRFVIIMLGMGAIALASANWRLLGAEDPFIVPVIFALFLGLGYMFTPGRNGQPVKTWKSEVEEQLAENEVAEEAPAISDATQASVTLYRKSSMMSMEVVYYISCDGKPVAKVEDGCRATVKIPAGNHEFTLSDEYSKGSTAPINVTLKAGEEVFIDCSFRSIWSGVAFKTAQPDDAQRDMVGLNSAT